MCQTCTKKPVIALHSGEQLCKKCFIAYFDRKVRKTIRVHDLIDKGDTIAVAVSGGKDSLTLLDLLHAIFTNNKSVSLFALLINEGIVGYRDDCVEHTKKFCAERNIPLHIFSYEQEFGFALDTVVKGRKPCSVCGVLRRNLLNTKARDLGATKLATGHNLDDEAQSILMNQFRSNMETSARLGPLTGVKDREGFIRRIKPLYFMTEKEVMTYAFLKNITDDFRECPYNKDSYRNQVREMLNKFEDLYPGTKHSVVQSFMEILPALKEKYKGDVPIKSCKKCGEPTSRDLCQKCVVLDQIRSS